jgi:protein-S-isoprenylcysteine O-methyltransferase Ste14
LIFPKPYADFAARLRVPAGFVLAAAFAWLAEPTRSSLLWGLPISVIGLLLRAWAAGHLAKNQVLAESGPFAWVRNPLYLGTATVALGLVVASRRLSLGVLFAVVFLCVYLPAVELEEGHLRNLFPAYADYAKRVSRFLPRPPEVRSPRRFSVELYRRNQEYNALLGFLAGAAFLYWKTL